MYRFLFLFLFFLFSVFAAEQKVYDLNSSFKTQCYTGTYLFNKAQKELKEKQYKQMLATLNLCKEYSPCQTMLGYIYANGIYVKPNVNKAIAEFKKAIKSNSVESMYNLGTL